MKFGVATTALNPNKESKVASSWTENLFTGAATLLAAVYVVVGVLVWLGMGNPGDYPRLVWVIVGLSVGALIAAGLFANCWA